MSNAMSTIEALAGALLLLLGGALALRALKAGGRSTMRARLQRLERTYSARPGESEAEEEDQTSVLEHGLRRVEAIWEHFGALAVYDAAEKAALEQALSAAGIRRPGALRIMMMGKVLGMLVGGPLLAGTMYLLAPTTDLVMLLMLGLIGTLAAGWLPGRYIRDRARRRQDRLLARLPDALDLMIIFANAGYGLDQAIMRLSKDLARSAPELAAEFTLTSTDLRLLADREQALEQLARRTGLEPMRALVSTLQQTQRYGTPLSQALRALAAEQRSKRILKMEERAGRMPVYITIPMILLILPAVVVIVGGPAMLQATKSLGAMGSGSSRPAERTGR